ncbi:nitrous oxidase accessory protein [Modicisalibacter ilicicola DSM 19980]|uniref:Nitrous oxidase accessory protein n=1 Tax=Modicisalibacter ilicicola DSM 19980 TaxID=1121942 RepID=A0A1M4SPH5_9GAMM|nr:nitrous oxide reductase family maturation protein NosD [Halomonas ilicicola]SHE34096.1 nitrous oxidase accessory protein [Halomonas ilicicola DSM 19980]
MPRFPLPPGARCVLLVIALFSLSSAVFGADLEATPGQSPQALIDKASDGDHLHLPKGRYPGPLDITRSLRISAEEQAIIDGQGEGHAVIIDAPEVTLEGLEIVNWGKNLTDLDAGIFVTEQGTNSVIRNNRLEGPGFGIWLDAVKGVRVVDNVIRGDTGLRSQDRGNGIHLFNVQDVRVSGNDITRTRDGIYIDTSSNNVLSHNTLYDLRYGIHYMYAYDNRVEDNLTHDTRTGYALMQSKRLTVVGNRSVNDDNYGILMNNITGSVIRDNRIEGITQPVDEHGEGKLSGGDGKAIFVYNSQFNEFLDNRFARSDIGIHLTAGSEDNEVVGNAFVDNRQQVKYVATRPQEWSREDGGNYWSDYLGWDLDNDGIGDTSHEPNDAMDRVLWRYPAARLLMHSPAVLALRWAQRQFPVFRPEGVKDSAPLMVDPTRDETET